MPHTPGPWKLGEFDEHLGYYCMTGGIRSGPAVLDGSDYGQKRCAEIAPEVKARMLADAALISAAPDLLAALIEMEREKSDYMQRNNLGDPARETTNKMARAAIAAALRHNAAITGSSGELPRWGKLRKCKEKYGLS